MKKNRPTHPTEQRAHALLQELAGHSARADASEKAIREGASARLDAVNKRLEELRPQVMVSSDARDEYQGLAVERHRLNTVVMAP